MPKYRFRILKRGDGRYQPQWKFAGPHDDWVNVLPGGLATRTLWGAERQCTKCHRWLVDFEKRNDIKVVAEWTV